MTDSKQDLRERLKAVAYQAFLEDRRVNVDTLLAIFSTTLNELEAEITSSGRFLGFSEYQLHTAFNTFRRRNNL